MKMKRQSRYILYFFCFCNLLSMVYLVGWTWRHNTVANPGMQYRAAIGPPAKRHLNGVLLAGRWWPVLYASWAKLL